jgi:hypothetical protein
MADFTTAITNQFRRNGATNYDVKIHLTVQGSVVQTTVCTSFQ